MGKDYVNDELRIVLTIMLRIVLGWAKEGLRIV